MSETTTASGLYLPEGLSTHEPLFVDTFCDHFGFDRSMVSAAAIKYDDDTMGRPESGFQAQVASRNGRVLDVNIYPGNDTCNFGGRIGYNVTPDYMLNLVNSHDDDAMARRPGIIPWLTVMDNRPHQQQLLLLYQNIPDEFDNPIPSVAPLVHIIKLDQLVNLTDELNQAHDAVIKHEVYPDGPPTFTIWAETDDNCIQIIHDRTFDYKTIALVGPSIDFYDNRQRAEVMTTAYDSALTSTSRQG